MTRSKIIKDLANGEVSLKTALMRAKVLMYELGDEKILNWIDNEIKGYPDNDPLPKYRTTRGQLRGSYMKGTMAANVTWRDVSLPLGNMPEDVAEKILEVRFTDGVEAISRLLDNSENERLGYALPADIFPQIAAWNDDLYMFITEARVVVPQQYAQNILDEVAGKLLDSLLLLEKTFGNLDELDIDASSLSDGRKQEIIERITINIYDDHSVAVGDGATVKGSTISS